MEFSADVVALCLDCRDQGVVSGSLRSSSAQPTNWEAPPWSLTAAMIVLLVFMLAMVLVPSLVVGIWMHLKGLTLTPANAEQMMGHPQANLVGVVAILGVHLFTLLIAWTVVTGWERRFTDVIDWTWHPRFRWPQALVTVAVLYGLAWLLQYLLPSGKTDFDRLLESSQTVRIAVAALAVITAPFVEELIYRGILYPALHVKFGRAKAIATVSGLFAVVHFMQYWGSVVILVSLTLLSVVLTIVRAYTGKLLPCFVIHFLYNLIGATLILVGYGLVR